MQERLVPFLEHLPNVREAYNLTQWVAPPSEKTPNNKNWAEKARKSLKALAAMELQSAKRSLGDRHHANETLRKSLGLAMETFYQGWRERFTEVQELMRRASEVLPESAASNILREVHPQFMESTCEAVEEALKQAREFREAVEAEQNRDQPEGRASGSSISVRIIAAHTRTSTLQPRCEDHRPGFPF